MRNINADINNLKYKLCDVLGYHKMKVGHLVHYYMIRLFNIIKSIRSQNLRFRLRTVRGKRLL
jgi:hypothetical protein